VSLLSYDDALAVIRRLVEVAASRGEALGSPIVLLGGTAMAAWRIRDHSNDVDLYVPEVPAESVEAVEKELRGVYGEGFRLDVTSGENVWGSILVRDIASSPSLGVIGDRIELRALRVEDLFLLKLASGRARDLDDLDLLAACTSADALVSRWNELVKWHGDRHAILGFADALVMHLVRLYRCDAAEIIGRLAVTSGQRESCSRRMEGGRAMDRAEVERAIRDEEAALEEVVRLLRGKAALDAWPEPLRVAFAVALAVADEHMPRAESWKIVALRRHLFGGAGVLPRSIAPPSAPTVRERRCAERLRGGLAACVGHRAGAYLASV
jgi:hypothetical protein